jgi:2-polyprenyl-3-methyl-5-hydroxy-6-metoxy-1,4-benzoquinol methylase
MENKRESLKNEVWEKYLTTCYKFRNKLTQRDFENYASICDRAYRKLLPQNKQARILDIGCGTGHFLYYLEKIGYTNHYGIDISPEQVEFVKNNITQRAETADVFEYLKAKNDQFDAIVGNDIIAHIPKDSTLSFLNLIYSSLKPNGKCILRTDNMDMPFPVKLRYVDFTIQTGYTESSFAQILRIAKFDDVRVFPFPLRRSSKVVWTLRKFFVYKLLLGVSFNSPSGAIIGIGIKGSP